jgi:hypothetical protein
MKKKHYIRPEIGWIEIDNTISLQMLSGTPPVGPGVRGDGSKKDSGPYASPFASPFADKPFN